MHKLAHLAARRFSAHRVVARILPTEWERGPARLATLYQRERPKLVLHFGVSADANSYVVETRARNTCSQREDAAGALPSDSVLDRNGPDTRDVALPAADIVARLAALKIPATTSDDAGSYLCNAVLYRSLLLAEEQDIDGVGFFHIPRVIPPALLKSKTERREMRFDWGSALLGGLEIVRTCLGRPPPSRRHVKFL